MYKKTYDILSTKPKEQSHKDGLHIVSVILHTSIITEIYLVIPDFLLGYR